ncbi:MAG: hypothetical protein V1725_03090 [archaeon]
MLELLRLKYETLEKIMLFELALAFAGVLHFAITYTFFSEHLMRAFIMAMLMILAAVITFIITYTLAMRVLEKEKHANS